MGITDLLPILAAGFEERVSLPIFVSQFVDKHGRFPRIAIDAYMLIFQSNHSNIHGNDQESNIVVRNVMAKLMSLTMLNVSYVVVLDGKFKPKKLRHEEGSIYNTSYDDELIEFRKVAFTNENYKEDSTMTYLIGELKRIFMNYKIDFIQSPGEAEAECAMLQKFGVVDYVLSNDTDVFVFGATKVLRNFLKSEDDILTSNSSVKDYYVTPVDMLKVKEKTGLDSNRLILIATLRGGDYSNGINRIGISRSTSIALCGTDFAKFYHRSPRKLKKKEEVSNQPLPDFSKLLIDCFVDKKCSKIFDIWALIKDIKTRTTQLRKFTNLLNECIKSRAADIFDLNLNFQSPFFIEEYFTLLYLFPIVSPQIFKFIPRTLSVGELEFGDNDLTIPATRVVESDTPVSWTEKVHRFNNNLPFVDIGILNITFGVNKPEYLEVLDSKFIDLHFSNKLSNSLIVPIDFNYKIKYIVVKLLSQISNFPNLSEFLKVTKKRVLSGIEFVMIKFDTEGIARALLNSHNNSDNDLNEEVDIDSLPRKEKWDHIWLPHNVVKLVNPVIIDSFVKLMQEKDVEKLKRSPQKHKAQQSTTLESLGMFSSLQKDPNKNLDILGKRPISPVKFKKGSPRKAKLLAGQSFVTTFFEKGCNVHEDNPFLDSFPLVNLKDKTLPAGLSCHEAKANNNLSRNIYDSMKSDIKRNPTLRDNELLFVKNKVISPKRKASSPPEISPSCLQMSPTKKQSTSNRFALSPDGSPINQKSIIGSEFSIPSSRGCIDHDELHFFDISEEYDDKVVKIHNRKWTSANSKVIEINESESDSEIQTSSIMEINLSAFENR